MRKLLLRLAVNAVALYAAISLMDGRGITPQSEGWVSILWLALIFGAINSVLKPILEFAGCGFIILTLGLGTLLINALLFYLAGLIGTQFGVGFTVDGFWPAFWGSLIVSIVSFFLNILIKDDDDKHRHDRQ